MALAVKLEADVLTDVLSTLRLRGRVFCRSELTAPWSMALKAGNFAHFHIIDQGGGWLRLDDHPTPIQFASGDLLIVPHGRGHILSDQPETAALPLSELLPGENSANYILRHGGGGRETRLVCGSFQFEQRDHNPLILLLPPLIHLHGHSGVAADWLEPTLKLLIYEANNARQGSETIITRLTDIIFVQAIRAWLEQQPLNSGGWLGALRDPQIGAALSLIHREPARDWQVATLATAVGMSRSPFAARFNALVGLPPLSYLTRWRMQLAASLLQQTNLTLTAIAARIGYDSEAALSKAFKRHFGRTPSAYRRMLLTDPSIAA